ncbi:MAG: hypothetical protein OXI54_11490 [Chloroflexota bacterium]|nr:hypothetical protein [Chloroflexota bacterium]MDE2684754.1 hypothetical protein [Chloroflexota bacterium]
MATVDNTVAQTIGALVEGQRQMEARLDRLEGKVDKLLWVNLGLFGAVIAATIVAAIR